MDMTLRCILGFVLTCTFASCEKIFDHNATVESPEAPSEYPVDRLLMDDKGRNIDVSITGRGDYHVNFRKKSDNKAYKFAIENLSERDRSFVRALPITETGISREQVVTPRYVTVRQDELDGLLEQKKKLRQEIKSTPDDEKVKLRSLRRDLRLLEPKIWRIEQQILEYWKQNPPK